MVRLGGSKHDRAVSHTPVCWEALLRGFASPYRYRVAVTMCCAGLGLLEKAHQDAMKNKADASSISRFLSRFKYLKQPTRS